MDQNVKSLLWSIAGFLNILPQMPALVVEKERKELLDAIGDVLSRAREED